MAPSARRGGPARSGPASAGPEAAGKPQRPPTAFEQRLYEVSCAPRSLWCPIFAASSTSPASTPRPPTWIRYSSASQQARSRRMELWPKCWGPLLVHVEVSSAGRKQQAIILGEPLLLGQSYHACAWLTKSIALLHAGALRRNPFAPVVPCHRVVASDMQLGGFSGSWGVSEGVS
jgi:hypothetical protein